jgi:hypothetical protein
MIYSWSTFLDCYSVFSLLQAYFLPTHGNGEVPVLGKLPYILNILLISTAGHCPCDAELNFATQTRIWNPDN